jgi:CSLREA domain-containing protein
MGLPLRMESPSGEERNGRQTTITRGIDLVFSRELPNEAGRVGDANARLSGAVMTDLLRLSRAVAIAAAVWASLVAGASLAATITVTSTSDAVNGADGVCTLREALLAASTNAASGGAAGERCSGWTMDKQGLCRCRRAGHEPLHVRP